MTDNRIVVAWNSAGEGADTGTSFHGIYYRLYNEDMSEVDSTIYDGTTTTSND